MDLQFGDILIHLDTTPAILLALVPTMVIMYLLPSLIKGIKAVSKFGVSSLQAEDENDEQ